MEIRTKDIGKFLKSLNEAECRYLELTINVSNGVKELIRRHKLTKEDVCSRFRISKRKYNDYISGNFEYSVKDMAALNAAFMDLEAEKLKEKVPCQVAKTD